MSSLADDKSLAMICEHETDIARAWSAALADGAPESDLVALIVDGRAFDPVRADAIWVTRRAKFRAKLNQVLSESRFAWALYREDDEVLRDALAPLPPGYVMRVYTAVMVGDSLCASAIGTMIRSERPS